MASKWLGPQGFTGEGMECPEEAVVSELWEEILELRKENKKQERALNRGPHINPKNCPFCKDLTTELHDVMRRVTELTFSLNMTRRRNSYDIEHQQIRELGDKVKEYHGNAQRLEAENAALRKQCTDLQTREWDLKHTILLLEDKVERYRKTSIADEKGKEKN